MKIPAFIIAAFTAISLFSCAGGDDNGSTSDAIIGKWQITAKSTDGIPVVLSNCDLRMTNQFTVSGKNYTEYFRSENGDCVPQKNQANEITKWINITGNHYLLRHYTNGQLISNDNFDAVFSADKNDMSMDYTDSDGKAVTISFKKFP